MDPFWHLCFTFVFILLHYRVCSVQPCEHNRLDETSILGRHRCHIAAEFGVFVDEDHSKLLTLYWLPNLYRRPYKSRFIANSSSYTTTLSNFFDFLPHCD